MPFTMEETNRYLGLWHQDFLNHGGEPHDPHTQEIIGLVRQDVMQQLVVQNRVAFIRNEQDGIHQLVETIRNLSPRMYVNLTDGIMAEIVVRMREIFPDVAHCTIDHYGDENCKQRIIALFEYVRDTLYERLHLEGKKPTLSIVSRVINMVFGNIPIITITLRKQLYSLGYLVDKVTESIEKVLDALYRFWRNPFVQIIVTAVVQELLYAIAEIGIQGGDINIHTIILRVAIQVIFRVLSQIHNNNQFNL